MDLGGRGLQLRLKDLSTAGAGVPLLRGEAGPPGGCHIDSHKGLGVLWSPGQRV